MFLIVKMLFVINFYQVKGDNIMLGKPSKQSSTQLTHDSSKANDGLDNTVSTTTNTDQQPYWQGDLQGFYLISNITVRNYNSYPTLSLIVGASVMDVTCPGSDVITCGHWREENESFLQTFSCNYSKPVRFIRIWREVQDHLILHEVSVQGTLAKISGLKYKSMMSKRLNTPSTSIRVAMVTECATFCHANQPCPAFSFRQGGQPNCVLATDVSMTSDTDWKTYAVSDYHNFGTCN